MPTDLVLLILGAGAGALKGLDIIFLGAAAGASEEEGTDFLWASP